MFGVKIVLLAFLLLPLVVGCSSSGRVGVPAQVEDRSVAPPPVAAARTAPANTSQVEPRIAAYIPPQQPGVSRPPANRAVEQLMLQAERQQVAGDHPAAVASLERALRIAPDDALLWHRLAGVRLVQGQHALVTQLAAKSNALTLPGDSALRRDNWRLIASARRGLGDLDGADRAERTAQDLR